MAGLKKPTNCKCGSLKLHREYHPERWVCNSCSEIIVSRKTKPQTGICRECGKSNNEVKFDKHGNICKKCKADYNKNYAKQNRDKLLEQKRDYYQRNKKTLRAKANEYWQGSWEPYLSDIYNRSKKGAGPNSKRARELEFTIIREDLYKLVKQQDHKCAITKLPLAHKWGEMNSASVDRIDSSKGYTKDNIQLVCKAINLMKSTHSNQETIEFLKKIKLKLGI